MDPTGSVKSFSIPTAIFIAVASALLGFGTAATLYPPHRIFEDTNEPPKFGSPKDIANAIDELKSAFTGGTGGQELLDAKVSTDPDDLHTHGFSENDHFPGM